MCGIVGYIGKRQAGPIILEGLRRLEYRGYDSAGIAVLHGGSFDTHKKRGKIDEGLDLLLKERPLHGLIGLGHTRWATHGAPTDENSHPHFDQSGKISVVHNGVIENYDRLKERMANAGHVFHSATDTEVLAHLIGEHYEKLKNAETNGTHPLTQAVISALKEVIGTYGIGVISSDHPGIIVGARRGMQRRLSLILMPLALGAVVSHSAESWPQESWERTAPEKAGLDESSLKRAADCAMTGEGSGCIIRFGKLVYAWGDQHHRYDLKSSTKSFGSIALGLAIKDAKVQLNDKARKIHPDLGVPPESNEATGWLDEITILDLASQTAGFQKPGGFTPLLFRPGTHWDYSDSGPNWLAECLTLAYLRDLDELMFARVFTPLGIDRQNLSWRKNAYRPRLIDGVPRREFGAGISASVDAMARVGLLMLRGGNWNGKQILTPEYAALATRPVPEHANLPVYKTSAKEMGPGAPRHYGLLWWNNADGTLANVPRDAYWSWGLYDSLILVVPSLDIVAARAGKSWARKENARHYDVLRPFYEPIIAAASREPEGGRGKTRDAASEPKRSAKIKWAPPGAIRHLAKGSDNWPITWADDDSQYTAFGDGNGFEPFTPNKLSLGFARIEGGAADFHGENIRSPSLEQIGDGRKGKKASGMISVRGVLYLWARNAGNSQLTWSRDHGRTWQWADWKFTNSFGCPAFLQFGRDYQGNEDGWIYVYSPDANDAYSAADAFVLARVPIDRIQTRKAYSFFGGLRAGGQPLWSSRIEDRRPVLSRPGACYRPRATFNPSLHRILLVHPRPNTHSRDAAGKLDSRFRGGLAIFEAMQPWGPFAAVFDTAEWDVAPGDSASIPAKGISADGRTLHLVFSGEDSFSVREFTLYPASD